MARHDALTLDREHISGGLRTDHKLRFTGINRADNACWSMKGG